MKLTDIMGLLGGLALFLYGMQMMSQGLENAAGDKMKQILEKLTSNRLLGVLVGAVITAVIQSSSATTVMVVGFVNSGMMTLTQAIWIIMGANIGTTITGQLIALDVGVLAPFIAFVGVAILVFLKNERIHYIGNIVAGLGILFIGMDMMSSSMAPLSESQEFVGLLTRFENPILGILAGMIFTAIIQSSSASVGILQALAASGIVTLNSAAFILFGQNIGTCITALLASVGANRNAKRTTIVHFTFNVIGTFLFTILCVVTPLIGWCCIYFKSLCFCFCPGFRALIQTDNYITSTFFCIQCMCMSLAAISDNSNCLTIQKSKVTVTFIENLCVCHCFHPPKIINYYIKLCQINLTDVLHHHQCFLPYSSVRHPLVSPVIPVRTSSLIS